MTLTDAKVRAALRKAARVNIGPDVTRAAFVALTNENRVPAADRDALRTQIDALWAMMEAGL